MADNLSDYLENKLLEHTVGKTSYTMPGTVYVGLATASPADDYSGSAYELGTTGSGYSRKAAVGTAWNSASGGTITTAAAIDFGTATADWGTVTHGLISDSPTRAAGNLLWHGALGTPKIVQSGDTFQIPAGSLKLSMA